MLHGRGYLVGDALTDEAMRDAWELHRESLRAEWAAENPPGTRGFSEWLCEIIPRHGERPVTRWWTAEHERHRAAWLLHGVLHTRTWPESQEPEHTFLFRVGYIDAAEYRAAEMLYDEAHEGEEAFLDGVCERAKVLERQRQERFPRGGEDSDKAEALDTMTEDSGEPEQPQLFFS